MTPEALLSQVDDMLSPGAAAPPYGAWPRVCVVLTRLALERALDRFWTHVEPDAAACRMQTQLLILPAYAGNAAASTTREAWYGLCRAAHHHAYELAPTAAELRTWHRAVTDLLNRLDAARRAREADRRRASGQTADGAARVRPGTAWGWS